MQAWYYILLILFPLSGGLLAQYAKVNRQINLKLMLAFAGAYLLSVVLFHLIPHLYAEINVVSGGLLLGGFFFQVFIERYSRGVEHGHLHIHEHGKKKGILPYEILISLSLHSFIEGMPLGGGLMENGHGEWSFLFGIVLHEFPAAFALVTILRSVPAVHKRIPYFLIAYASMSSLGATTSQLLSHTIDPRVFEYLMAFVAGTFLHIATTILFENSENHRFTWNKIMAIVAGVGLAALVSLL